MKDQCLINKVQGVKSTLGSLAMSNIMRCEGCPATLASGIPRTSSIPSACGGIVQLTNITALHL